MAHTTAQDNKHPTGWADEAHAEHSHHVIDWKILVGVLFVLLVFTMLTVNTAQLEVWFAGAFDVEIPQLVNVFVAMSIATVKAMLVCMFFMGLKYDNPLNSIILVATLFCLGLFLGFTAADLGNRGTIERFKVAELDPGGYGGQHIQSNGMNLVEFRREQKMGTYPSEAAFWASYYDKQIKAGDHPHHHEADTQDYFTSLGYNHDIEASSANRTVRARGLTPGLFDAHHDAYHIDAHGDDHAGDHADDHASDDHLQRGDPNAAEGGPHRENLYEPHRGDDETDGPADNPTGTTLPEEEGPDSPQPDESAADETAGDDTATDGADGSP